MDDFSRKQGGLLYLLLFTLVLPVSLGVLSIAPDDFVSTCTAMAEPGSFNNSNQKVLLDTQFYLSTTLLSSLGEDKLWISLDFNKTTSYDSVSKHESQQRGVEGVHV